MMRRRVTYNGGSLCGGEEASLVIIPNEAEINKNNKQPLQ